MKKLFFINMTVLLLANACRNAETRDVAMINADRGFIASLDTANYTTVEWLDSLQNFGAIQEGDSIKVSFTFKNTGTAPLFLSNARTSCGCTVVSFPKEAILPGHTENLVARFNSKFHPGYTHKTIVVKSNTKNNINHTLVIEGTVIKKIGK